VKNDKINKLIDCCITQNWSPAKTLRCPESLNVHGTRIATKTQHVATGTAHKLNLNESAENSQREIASGAARNAINGHCEFKIGLKRTIEPWESLFSSNGHTTMHHTPTSARKSSADRPPIAVRFLKFRVPIVNFRFSLESPRGHCSRLRPCTFNLHNKGASTKPLTHTIGWGVCVCVCVWGLCRSVTVLFRELPSRLLSLRTRGVGLGQA
jgi:hypothetical protein